MPVSNFSTQPLPNFDPARAAAPAGSPTSPYILYAEDNPSDAVFFRRAYEKNGGQLPLLHFSNGVSAEAFLHETAGQPDRLPRLLILDNKMPGLSGLDLLERVRGSEDLRHLPVILLSASYEPSDIQRAYDNRVNAYVVKPNRYRELKELTASITSFWGRFNQIPAA